MKATIIRPDGTRIEAEGTPEELAQIAGGWGSASCTCGAPTWLHAATCPRFVRLAPVVPNPGWWNPPAWAPFYVGDVVPVVSTGCVPPFAGTVVLTNRIHFSPGSGEIDGERVRSAFDEVGKHILTSAAIGTC